MFQGCEGTPYSFQVRVTLVIEVHVRLIDLALPHIDAVGVSFTVNSSQSCERLEQEKDELRGAFDGVLQKLQEQHRSDLAELEERLRAFYSAEWERVHQAYQQEADKCKAQMEQQVSGRDGSLPWPFAPTIFM